MEDWAPGTPAKPTAASAPQSLATDTDVGGGLSPNPKPVSRVLLSEFSMERLAGSAACLPAATSTAKDAVHAGALCSDCGEAGSAGLWRAAAEHSSTQPSHARHGGPRLQGQAQQAGAASAAAGHVKREDRIKGVIAQLLAFGRVLDEAAAEASATAPEMTDRCGCLTAVGMCELSCESIL